MPGDQPQETVREQQSGSAWMLRFAQTEHTDGMPGPYRAMAHERSAQNPKFESRTGLSTLLMSFLTQGDLPHMRHRDQHR